MYSFNELAQCLDSFKGGLRKGIRGSQHALCGHEFLGRQLVAHGFLST